MQWKPAHETHAVERVACTFQFLEAVPAKPMQAMLGRAVADFTSRGFTTMQRSEVSLPVIFGPAGAFFHPSAVNQAATNDPSVGRIFHSLKGVEIMDEVALTKEFFPFLTGDTILGLRSKNLLSKTLCLILDNCPLLSL